MKIKIALACPSFSGGGAEKIMVTLANKFYELGYKVVLPIVFYTVSNYGAMGAAITWAVVQVVVFFIWPPYVHSKFAKGIHKDWMIKDIFPSFLATMSYLVILKLINIDFEVFNRIEVFLILICLGCVLLVLNAIIYPNIRKLILAKIEGRII